MGYEMDKDFFNKVYEETPRYRQHYKELSYYPVYLVALGMIKDIEEPQILELGCGTGQFAQMLWDNGYTSYMGIDFSETAIGIASGLSPQVFEAMHIKYAPSLYHNFNTVVALEVLEHIEEDLSVIRDIPEGMNIIFSVPNFEDQGHVRFFRRREEITKRYENLIDIKEMVPYQHWCVVKGIRGKNDH